MWSVTLFAVTFLIIYKVLSAVRKMTQGVAGVPGESVWWYIKAMREKRSVMAVHKELLEKYGPCYMKWLGVHNVNLADPTATRFLFQRTDIFQKSLQENAPKNPLVSKWIGDASIVYVEGDQWKRQKKLISPAFHVDTLRAVAPLFSDVIDKFIGHYFEDKKSIDLNVHDAMIKFTLEILGTAIFGTEFNCLSHRPSLIVTSYEACKKRLGRPIPLLVNILSGFGLWDRLPLASNDAFRNDIDTFRGILLDIVTKRRKEAAAKEDLKEENSQKKDLVQLMFDAFEHGDALSDKELMDNLSFFVMAAHDTTATSLCMALHLLAHHTEMQDRARAEVLGVINAGEKSRVTYDAQKKMPFLTNVIKETLRMFPPVMDLPVRKAKIDTEIPFSDGSKVKIPKGTGVTVAVFAQHINPRVWEKPLEFRPDRFDTDTIPAFAWVPFGGGPRQCIGLHFSLIEQRLFLAEMLRRYTLEPVTPLNDYSTFDGPSMLLKPRECIVRFVRRD